MTYRIVHRTEYEYDAPVSSSYGEAHLQPRGTATQECFASAVTIEPSPEDHRERRDFFGNRVTHFHVREPHTALLVTATSVVDVRPRPTPPELLDSPPWEACTTESAAAATAELLDARQFALSSPAVPRLDEAATFAAPSFPAGRPVLEAVADLSHRIWGEFDYSPGSTSVSTTVQDVLEARAGVCQDFAHLALSGLRSLGLPARYVSGYLETLPPPGQPKLQGADMSHAWLSVFVAGIGWVDIDPTNDQFANERYVTLAWGRDYADVPPLKGVIFTDAAENRLTVTVDVVEIPDDDPEVAPL